MSNQFSPLFPDPWQGLDIQINAGYIKSLKDIDPEGITDVIAMAAQGSIIATRKLIELGVLQWETVDGGNSDPTQPLAEVVYKPALEWLTADCTACRCTPLTIYRSDLGTFRIVKDNWATGEQLYCATDKDDLCQWFDAKFQSTNLSMYDLKSSIWEKENYY
jgi:hypothetical protein